METYSYKKEGLLLSVRNVSKSYRDNDGNPRKIIEDINFDIYDVTRPGVTQGQICALIGQSGIGKSTLLKVLTALENPDPGGEVLIGGIPVKQGDVGMVPQNYALFDWYKVKKNLYIAAKENPSISDTEKAIAQIAEDFNFTEHLTKYPYQLSGGQRQRVSIAQQILTGSDFIVLDEPFSGLDTIMIDKVMKLLVQAACVDERKTLIIVSHDLSNSLAISDTVYILAKPDKEKPARLVRTIDMMERGLAWHPDIKQLPAFHATLNEVKSLL